MEKTQTLSSVSASSDTLQKNIFKCLALERIKMYSYMISTQSYFVSILTHLFYPFQCFNWLPLLTLELSTCCSAEICRSQFYRFL